MILLSVAENDHHLPFLDVIAIFADLDQQNFISNALNIPYKLVILLHFIRV